MVVRPESRTPEITINKFQSINQSSLFGTAEMTSK